MLRREERKRVLSMRPLKIGTPTSMHLAITSRRFMFTSSASSVGVKWLATSNSPSLENCRVPCISLGTDVSTKKAEIAGWNRLAKLSDRVGNVDEFLVD